MDNLGKLLGRKRIEKPTEVGAIVAWCTREYPAFTVAAQKRSRDYLVTVPNGSLAQEVQMRLIELKDYAGIANDARITIRIA